jgi:hypothetical protein
VLMILPVLLGRLMVLVMEAVAGAICAYNAHCYLAYCLLSTQVAATYEHLNNISRT